MAPEWFKTPIDGPAYGKHMRKPGRVKIDSPKWPNVNVKVAMEVFAIAMTGISAMTEIQQGETQWRF